MNEKLALKTCVVCGSRRVRREQVSVRLNDGRTITDVEADVCAACGECFYDLDAMRRLEAE